MLRARKTNDHGECVHIKPSKADRLWQAALWQIGKHKFKELLPQLPFN